MSRSGWIVSPERDQLHKIAGVDKYDQVVLVDSMPVSWAASSLPKMTLEARPFFGRLNPDLVHPKKSPTALISRFDLAQLWQSTPWRAGHLIFRAAPGRNAESDADQKCNPAADATPRSGVVGENQGGDHSEV
jgi:hypothetical protein